MPLRCLTIAFVALLVLKSGTHAAPSPREAEVVTDTADVKSGPGDEYYATSRLSAGSRVTIYRVTKSGWCAIQPPEGSFSYVRADHVRPTGIPRLLQVIAEDSRTRVGSELDRSAGVEYVRLKPGETLLSLDNPVTLGDGNVRWYKISPPSGEFRWIHARHVRAIASASQARDDASPPATGIAAQTEVSTLPDSANPPSSTPLTLDQAVGSAISSSQPISPKTQPESNRSSSTTASDTDLRQSLDAARSLLGSMAESARTAATLSSSVGDLTSTEPRPAEQSVDMEKTSVSASAAPPELATAAIPSQQMVTEPIPARQHSIRESVGRADAAVPNNGPGFTSEEVALTSHASNAVGDHASTEIVRLELALSRIVTQEIGSWQLNDLRSQIARVAQQTPHSGSEQHATQLLARVDEFIELQQRHQLMVAAEQQGQAAAISLASAIEPAARLEYQDQPAQATMPSPPWPTQAPTEVDTPNFVGQGWLVPVFTSRDDIPRFAITDDEGSVLQFVIPRAGLNLRRYLRQEVGIVGHPASRPVDGSQPALVAQRIVVLDRHR